MGFFLSTVQYTIGTHHQPDRARAHVPEFHRQLATYLGYNLDEPLPDYSSLTRIRLRYGLEVFRRFFDTVVEQCQQAGLVWGRELYFDATQVHYQSTAAY